MMQRTVFFISDRTGITAETLGSSLITQFEGIQFQALTLPFVDSKDKAEAALERIYQAHQEDGVPPIVFSTLIDDALRQILEQSTCFFIDFFQTFIGPLEKELGVPSSHTAQGISYDTRIEAVNFALQHDDGSNPRGFNNAELILLGVSRSGKTPCCLYLAMHYGIRVANYPLTDDDLIKCELPSFLQSCRAKLIGLSIDPARLQAIRQERRPDSPYADLKQCHQEIKAVEKLFYHERIPYLSSTNRSIEELATKLMMMAGIERNPIN